jgi:hypothetical protein
VVWQIAQAVAWSLCDVAKKMMMLSRKLINNLSKRNISTTIPRNSNFKPIASVMSPSHHATLSHSSTSLQHRDTPDNTEETYFDFTPENYQRVRDAATALCAKRVTHSPSLRSMRFLAVIQTITNKLA